MSSAAVVIGALRVKIMSVSIYIYLSSVVQRTKSHSKSYHSRLLFLIVLNHAFLILLNLVLLHSFKKQKYENSM